MTLEEQYTLAWTQSSQTVQDHKRFNDELAELRAELAEAHERIEELEHELDTQVRDNDGFTVVDGVYEELD